MSDLPPAGWYPDPEQAGQERWWNGTAWSDDRRTVQLAPPPMPQPMYVTVAPPPRRNGMSTAGLVLSIISMVLNPFAVLSILGIIFGSIGSARAKDIVVDGKPVGAGAGGWAIGLGIVSTIWFIIQFQFAMQNLQDAFNSF